jgi:hypothetical protein
VETPAAFPAVIWWTGMLAPIAAAMTRTTPIPGGRIGAGKELLLDQGAYAAASSAVERAKAAARSRAPSRERRMPTPRSSSNTSPPAPASSTTPKASRVDIVELMSAADGSRAVRIPSNPERNSSSRSTSAK